VPDPLVAEFADDLTTLGKPKAKNAGERRVALTSCLVEVWPGVDIDTLERIDDATAKLHGWAMWRRS
jgi:hypothetical protein